MIRKTSLVGLLALFSTATAADTTTGIIELTLNNFKKEVVAKAADKDFDVEANLKSGKVGADWITAATFIGVLMWIWSFLFYGKTDYTDTTMKDGAPPLAWFWDKMSDTTLGFTAASYFSAFWIYMLISVVEFAGWVMYFLGDPNFFVMWSMIATYGTLVLYLLPPLFALLQVVLPAGSGGVAAASAGYTNAWTLFVFQTCNWLFQFLVHLFFQPKLADYATALNVKAIKAKCGCKKVDAGISKAQIEAATFAANKCFEKLQSDTCTPVVHTGVYKRCGKDFSKCTIDESAQCAQGDKMELPTLILKCKAFELTTGEKGWTYQKDAAAAEAEVATDDGGMSFL